MIEILIVIAIIGILASLIFAAVSTSRSKGHDARIRSDVSQLRYLAESVYDTQGANYSAWSAHASVVTAIPQLLDDIDENSGDTAGSPYVTVIRDSQVTNYCISTPLRAQVGKYYCIDATGVFQTADTPCPDYGPTDAPLRCPGN